MMRTLVFLMLIFQVSIVSAQDAGAIFFVRHAEVTYEDGNRNPELNEKGKLRAEKWATYFSQTDFVSIFSTDLHRTRSTAEAISSKKGLQIQYYDPFSEESLDLFRKASEKGNVLVVGHSNTVPSQVNALLGEEKYGQLDEKEFSKVFMIVRKDSLVLDFVFDVQ